MWYAGHNSIDGGGNSGWLFYAPAWFRWFAGQHSIDSGANSGWVFDIPYRYPLTYIGHRRVDIERDSMRLEFNLRLRSIAEFRVIDGDDSLLFQRGESVVIYEYDDVPIYEGVVYKIPRQTFAPKLGMIHSIACIDWTYLADKRIMAEAYADKTCGFIVNDIVTNYLAAEGVTVGTIQAGATLTTAKFPYVKVSDALDKLAEASGFVWYIDVDKKLYFVSRTTSPAPWAATVTDMLQGSASYVSENPQYRNVQYLRGGKATTTLQTESQIGDGEKRAFAMGYPLASEPVSITVDGGAAQTVGVKGIDTGKQWYWSNGDEVLTHDSGEVILTDANTLTVEYYGLYDIIVRATEDDEIAERADIEGFGTGQVEDVADAPEIDTQMTAIERALALLETYAQEGAKFKYTTRRSGIKVGQLQPITHARYRLAATEFLIESVTAYRQAHEWRWAVSGVQGPPIGEWSSFFKALSRIGQVTPQDIESDAVLIILKQLAEALGLTDAVSNTPITPPYYASPCPGQNPIIAGYWTCS